MSYDYLFFRLREAADCPANIAEADTVIIGSPDEIRESISSIFPDATWDSGGWGYLNPADKRGEICLSDPTGKSFRVSHVSVHEVQALCNALRLTAFDGQQLTLIQPEP